MTSAALKARYSIAQGLALGTRALRRRNAAQVNSQGRKPLDTWTTCPSSPNGAAETDESTIAPLGLNILKCATQPGVSPLAINCRPDGPQFISLRFARHANKAHDSHRTAKDSAFTLFEVILAIALSATLLGLIGTAINLYLTQVDASRSRVEEAQLARSILATIADDIRGAAIYQPQDTSAIAKLMASGTAFDVDSIDKAGSSSSGSTSATSASSIAALSSAASSSSASSSSSGTSEESDGTLPLGLSGTTNELYVDVNRLPRQEELFSTVTGYQNAQSPNSQGPALPGTSAASSAEMVPPADVKSVHYYLRAGEKVAPGSASVTALSPGGQQNVGGLVRQEIPYSPRVFAEQSGNSGVLDANQKVLAPEVVQIAFRYYDGSQVTDDWNMEEQKKLPLAVEVRLWLTSPNMESTSIMSPDGSSSLAANVREYRQTVYLPMAATSEAAADSSASAGTSTSSNTGTSTDSSSTTGSGSSFDQ